jgi:hypothetical protein
MLTAKRPVKPLKLPIVLRMTGRCYCVLHLQKGDKLRDVFPDKPAALVGYDPGLALGYPSVAFFSTASA